MTSSVSSSPDGRGPGLTLAVNTAEEVLQLALGAAEGKGLRPVAHREWEAAGRFAEVLMPGLADLLAEAGQTPSDISRIACVRGPGSFTGLRIGLASVAGLAAGLAVPTAGLDHLALLANHAAPRLDGVLAVCVHARTRQVAFQAFSCPDNAPLDKPRPMRLEQVAEALAGLPGPVRLLGTGVRRNREFFDGLENVLLLGTEFERYPAETLLTAAAAAGYAAEPIDPCYLRPSDAEENLESIAKARGLDPDKARRLLDNARGRS